MQFSWKYEQTVDHFHTIQNSASAFEDQRLKRTDFTVVHDSPSIRAGPSIALFQKLEDGELSDKVFPGGSPSSESHDS